MNLVTAKVRQYISNYSNTGKIIMVMWKKKPNKTNKKSQNPLTQQNKDSSLHPKKKKKNSFKWLGGDYWIILVAFFRHLHV